MVRRCAQPAPRGLSACSIPSMSSMASWAASGWPAPTSRGVPLSSPRGDHYFAPTRLSHFLADQLDADVLVDVDMKNCDDEDMKVFLNRQGKLRTMTKTFLEGPCLGEFTGLVRF